MGRDLRNTDQVRSPEAGCVGRTLSGLPHPLLLDLRPQSICVTRFPSSYSPPASLPRLSAPCGFPREWYSSRRRGGATQERSFAHGGGSLAAAATTTSGTIDVITAVDVSVPPLVTLCALVTNYNLNIVDQEDPSTGLPISTESVSITFSGLPPSAGALEARCHHRQQCSHYPVLFMFAVLPQLATVTLLANSTTTGWAKPVWLAAGSPLYPDAAEIEAEMLASQPAVVMAPVTAGPLPGQITVLLPDLVPYAVASLRVDVRW